MIRTILLWIGTLTTSCALAQVYKGNEGEVRFFSSAPLEDIEAVSKTINCVLKSSTGETAVLISIKSFSFSNGLMQEHFNDSYLESDRYPDATFTGRLNSRTVDDVVTETKTTASGTLTIHGVSHERIIDVTIKPAPNGVLTVSGKFSVKLSDHKIKIPRIVFKNIAEAVEVSFVLTLKKSDK